MTPDLTGQSVELQGDWSCGFPSLKMLRAGLDGALSNLGQWKVSTRGLERDNPEVPSHPNHSVILCLQSHKEIFEECH